MKFALSATLLSLAGLATASIIPRNSCPLADRFGSLTVSSPSGATSYKPGDPINIHADFTCAINFGIVPSVLDYTIVPTNNRDQQTYVLASGRGLHAGGTSDIFTTKIPNGFFLLGIEYAVVVTETYPVNGSDGGQAVAQAVLRAPITIS